MNDPHVVALIYRVEHSDHVDFKKARPLTAERPAFRVTIDAGEARVEMLHHFATEKAARDAVQPFLDAWALAADLKAPEGRLRFAYNRPEIIDRNPPAGEAIGVGAALISAAGATANFVGHASYASWPEPPADLAMTPDVKALHTRWLGHLDGKERLLSAAYWALTMIEAAPGAAGISGPARKAAGEFFNLDPKILSKLGKITSNRGGVEEGRKAEGRNKKLTPNERRWLQAAFKALVERAALRAHYDAPPPIRLTLDDLPDLP